MKKKTAPVIEDATIVTGEGVEIGGHVFVQSEDRSHPGRTYPAPQEDAVVTEPAISNDTAPNIARNLLQAHSRKEMRKMMSIMRKKPKRGFTKPLHSKAYRTMRNKMRSDSRRINRIQAQVLKERV